MASNEGTKDGILGKVVRSRSYSHGAGLRDAERAIMSRRNMSS